MMVSIKNVRVSRPTDEPSHEQGRPRVQDPRGGGPTREARPQRVRHPDRRGLRAAWVSSVLLLLLRLRRQVPREPQWSPTTSRPTSSRCRTRPGPCSTSRAISWRSCSGAARRRGARRACVAGGAGRAGRTAPRRWVRWPTVNDDHHATGGAVLRERVGCREGTGAAMGYGVGTRDMCPDGDLI